MAMAQVTSADHKAFPSVSAYLRNPAHLVSSASVPTSISDFTSPKYLMEAPSDCPVSWPMPDHFLPSEIKLQQGTSFPSDNGLPGAIPNTDWQQFIDPATVAYSSGLVPPGAVSAALMSNSEMTKLANGNLSYTPRPSPSPGVDRGATGSNAWATSNLTVDPSKGGLALQGSTSQCFAEFPSDPGFAERAARYSSMGYGQQSPNKLSRTSSMRGDNNATEEAVKSALDEGKLFSKLHKVSQEAGRSPSKEDSLSSAQNSMEQASRKRKSNEDKCKDVATRKTESEDTKVKRQKASEGSKDEGKAKTEKSSSENSGSTSPKSAKENPKPPEPPKQDYIHVRARRGQATDSHSLAERVRREKISERMKFLQDLVPGCSKVTGKAVMLDEIINYVQSLQRQVEFLSMKLAAVNPRLDINLDGLLTKEILQGRAAGSPVVLNHDVSSNYPHIPQLQHVQQGVMQLGACGLDLRSLSSVENTGFGDSASQTSTVWDGELQSVVQMSFGALTQELQGHLPAGHMKVEI